MCKCSNEFRTVDWVCSGTNFNYLVDYGLNIFVTVLTTAWSLCFIFRALCKDPHAREIKTQEPKSSFGGCVSRRPLPYNYNIMTRQELNNKQVGQYRHNQNSITHLQCQGT